jgi:hypothetical protein
MFKRSEPVNQTTKRFARTLNEAFGPHTGQRIAEPDPLPGHERALFIVALFALAILAWVL